MGFNKSKFSNFFVSMLIPMALIMFIGMFFSVFFKAHAENEKNSGMPVEKKHAKIVTKRYVMDSPKLGSLILFEFDDGSRKEISVNAQAASIIAENDTGIVTYQGTKFIGFERDTNK